MELVSTYRVMAPTLTRQMGQRRVPLAHDSPRQDRQNEWPHCVVHGSSGTDAQMAHSKPPSSSLRKAGVSSRTTGGGSGVAVARPSASWAASTASWSRTVSSSLARSSAPIAATVRTPPGPPAPGSIGAGAASAPAGAADLRPLPLAGGCVSGARPTARSISVASSAGMLPSSALIAGASSAASSAAGEPSRPATADRMPSCTSLSSVFMTILTSSSSASSLIDPGHLMYSVHRACHTSSTHSARTACTITHAGSFSPSSSHSAHAGSAGRSGESELDAAASTSSALILPLAAASTRCRIASFSLCCRRTRARASSTEPTRPCSMPCSALSTT
mmetsp:Transcript_32136/g.103760  ORF Transcript_32136/g.103760 Transcript_32136/m.103760 type:complete len:333 (-) Transcript_32136:121-1119(-)